MTVSRICQVLVFVTVSVIINVEGLEHCGDLLDYGPGTSDLLFPQYDDSCLLMPASQQVVFDGRQWDIIYLCPNGAFSFGTAFTRFSSITDGMMLNPTDNCLLLFYEDHDVRKGGYIYYNVYESSAPASAEASAVFAAVEAFVFDKFLIDFDPVYVLKATWEEVPNYSFTAGQHNTFQLLYATDGTAWFAFAIYADGRMLYENQTPFVGTVSDGLAAGISENPDGTPLLRPDQTLVYQTNTGTCRGMLSFNEFIPPTCVDPPPPCTQAIVCSQTGYVCACDQPGYQLDDDGITCIPCSGGTFGLNCDSDCDCIDEHTTDYCDHVTGACQCNEYWTGTRCEVDVDECQLGTHNCSGEHVVCSNIPDGFECVCDTDYKRNGNDFCVPDPHFEVFPDCDEVTCPVLDCEDEEAKTPPCACCPICLSDWFLLDKNKIYNCRDRNNRRRRGIFRKLNLV